MNVTITVDGKELLSKDIGTFTHDVLAAHFCALDDDGQAQFFEEVGRIMGTWQHATLIQGAGPEMQGYYVGKHMRDGECRNGCVSDAGRRFILSVAETMMEPSTEPAQPPAELAR